MRSSFQPLMLIVSLLLVSCNVDSTKLKDIFDDKPTKQDKSKLDQPEPTSTQISDVAEKGITEHVQGIEKTVDSNISKTEQGEIDLQTLRDADIDNYQAEIKARYLQFLQGTHSSFTGDKGNGLIKGYQRNLERSISRTKKFDFQKDRSVVYKLFPGESGYKEEFENYSFLLQGSVLYLAYAYSVEGKNNPYYKNPEILALYKEVLNYLYDRGVRDGMTFHYNYHRMHEMEGAPLPRNGAGNIVHMELRMGAYCQSILMMEEFIKDDPIYDHAVALIKHLEMLGVSSGHVRYYEPYKNPDEFKYRGMSDAIQMYTDNNLVSALLEKDSVRKKELLIHASKVYTDSLKIIPGWAGTIKPDFSGYHHRAIYGNAYTDGFLAQASFAVYVLHNTPFQIPEESITNLKEAIKMVRLYCQKYSMPFAIRGRFPHNTHSLQRTVISAIITLASPLGLNDEEMKTVFKRLWDPQDVGYGFVLSGGRGKMARGFYLFDMLEALEEENITPEPDPNGHWYKPYAGLSIHRKDNWMATARGYSSYIWDYEAGKKMENLYGQYLSHGMITIFNQGNPVSDVKSGYDVSNGWDWYRLPGTTAVHYPLQKRNKPPKEHRLFSTETFLGGLSLNDENGVFSMILNDREFPEKKGYKLKAKKSVFFVDNMLVLLGSDIYGGDGIHEVETTIFQSNLNSVAGGKENWIDFKSQKLSTKDKFVFKDPANNAYIIPKGQKINFFEGEQKSFDHFGKPSKGNYATIWFEHGKNPENEAYEAAIFVNGGNKINELLNKKHYTILAKDEKSHAIEIADKQLKMFALFEAQAVNDSILKEVSSQCILSYQEKDNGRLFLSAVNPDMNRVDDVRKLNFKFINADLNQYLPDRPVHFDVTLEGLYESQSNNPNVKIKHNSGKTVLSFTTTGGFAQKIILQATK